MTTHKPTVLLVHGAFADGSSWNAVSAELAARGLTVRALSNPLRGLAYDGDYVASVAQQVPGDVVLVGHSYGGPVITHAASKADNVKGLVYVAAFGIDKGESALGSVAAFPPAPLGEAVVPNDYPTSSGSAVELTIDQGRFREIFAADLDEEFTEIAGRAQRPVAAAALNEELQVDPAWRTLPSWFVVATADNAIHPDAQRAAAKRLNAKTIEIQASHAIALSQPQPVADIIAEAVATVSA
jgi:pimeloyl-ACP methyl ester carboxylesterase